MCREAILRLGSIKVGFQTAPLILTKTLMHALHCSLSKTIQPQLSLNAAHKQRCHVLILLIAVSWTGESSFAASIIRGPRSRLWWQAAKFFSCSFLLQLQLKLEETYRSSAWSLLGQKVNRVSKPSLTHQPSLEFTRGNSVTQREVNSYCRRSSAARAKLALLLGGSWSGWPP